jgi:hypothetical protein
VVLVHSTGTRSFVRLEDLVYSVFKVLVNKTYILYFLLTSILYDTLFVCQLLSV